MPDYELFIRNSRTLALLGEVTRYEYARWSRRAREGGTFEVHVPRSALSTDLVGLTESRLLEVRRDGEMEFAGIVTDYELRDPSFGRTRGGDMWALKGPDLLGFFLSARIAEPSALESQSATPAETAIKHYVARALGSSASAARQADTWLSGVTFAVATDQARGEDVDVDVLRKPLLPLVTDLLTRGNLVHAMGFQAISGLTYAGYSFDVAAVLDRTVASGALPFSVSWDNVAAMIYRQSGLSAHNALYVLGDGTGDARTVEEVTASDLTPTPDDRFTEAFRREDVVDARDQASSSELADAGKTELLRRFDGAVSIEAEALQGGSSPYRDTWNVGDLVTLAVPEVGIEIDRLVAEATVELKRGDGEFVSMALGDRAMTEQAINERRWRRTLAAQVE